MESVHARALTAETINALPVLRTMFHTIDKVVEYRNSADLKTALQVPAAQQ